MQIGDESPRPLNARLLMLVFCVALVVRMTWGVTAMVRSADPTVLQFPDENDYWSLAQSLVRGDGLVGEHGFAALRMPLFPAILSPFAGVENGVVYAKVVMWSVGALAALNLSLS